MPQHSTCRDAPKETRREIQLAGAQAFSTDAEGKLIAGCNISAGIKEEIDERERNEAEWDASNVVKAGLEARECEDVYEDCDDDEDDSETTAGRQSLQSLHMRSKAVSLGMSKPCITNCLQWRPGTRKHDPTR